MNKFFTFLVLMAAFGSHAQFSIPDSTYVYDENGQKVWYYIQKDVFTFRLSGDAEYTGPVNNAVDNQDYWIDVPTHFNEIRFNPSSPMMQRYSQMMQVYSQSDYEISSVALTKNASADYTQQEYYRTDDRIMVRFHDPNIAQTTIDNFMTTYSLALEHQPDPGLPSTVAWTYVFKIIPVKGEETNSVKLAQQINENEPALVKLAEPNMYATFPLACQPTTEVGQLIAGTNGTWHIRNDGSTIWNGMSGTNDADADICECWGEGYTGSGIRIGVIDFGGIEFSHDDFAGSNIPQMYDASSGTYHSTNHYLDPANFHGMNVTGVVSATPNNDGLGQRYAVGAAYGAETIPYIVDDFSGGIPASNSQIMQSIQQCVLDGVDVINMSFQTDAGIGTIGLEIQNAVTVGRPDVLAPGGAWGIVCVAGTGNVDGEISNFPANMNQVIGVGWSNPEDYRCSYNAPGAGGGWSLNPSDGSPTGPPSFHYDVVAPGELIVTTGLSSISAYNITLGASFSSPIVASIAAMMLEKNPNLEWYNLKTFLHLGAEQVNPGTYDYNMYPSDPGYNYEMYYGRVSCINSLNLHTVGIEEQESQMDLTVLRQSETEYLIFVPQSEENLSYQLYDVSGRLINQDNISMGSSEVLINLNEFSNGLYIFTLQSNGEQIASTKLTK